MSVADLTLMLALVFVLARNILKLVVERRRALPFARFRAKLVAALLGLTLIPAVLVLLVGSEHDPQHRQPLVLAADRHGDQLGARDRERLLRRAHARGDRARHGAGAGARRASISPPAISTTIRGILGAELGQRQLSLVEVYRVDRARDAAGRRRRRSRGADPAARGFAPAFVLASRTASGGQNWSLEQLPSGGELLRGSAPIRPSPDAPPTGVVIVSVYLTDELARHSAAHRRGL